jgi:hypothetical protein
MVARKAIKKLKASPDQPYNLKNLETLFIR